MRQEGTFAIRKDDHEGACSWIIGQLIFREQTIGTEIALFLEQVLLGYVERSGVVGNIEISRMKIRPVDSGRVAVGKGNLKAEVIFHRDFAWIFAFLV